MCVVTFTHGVKIAYLSHQANKPMSEEQRTILQNKALHKYCELLAEALNDAGLDMKVVLKPEVDIPWTKESVKNHLWRPIQEIMMDKESTTEMSTADPGKIYEVLDRHISEKHGVHVEWPSNQENYMESMGVKR